MGDSPLWEELDFTDQSMVSQILIKNGLYFLPIVERYSPQENRWHTIAPMGTRRKHLGCSVYQDMIYAVGGRDDTTELSSAERFNPRTNQWSPVVAMTSRRSGVSIESIQEDIN